MKIEKAIKILEPYKKSVFGDASEKYGGSISVEEIIELLKELEVKNAIVINSLGGRCPKCEKTISRAWECCPYCYQRVKWNDN